MVLLERIGGMAGEVKPDRRDRARVRTGCPSMTSTYPLELLAYFTRPHFVLNFIRLLIFYRYCSTPSMTRLILPSINDDFLRRS